jgi:hypothetical protein
MSEAADNLGQNIGKLYRESTSVEADVGGLYNQAISIDNNPIDPGGGGSDNPFVADVPDSSGGGGDEAGSSFPFEIITETTDTGDLDVTVVGSYVYDFSGSFDEPVLVAVDTLENEIGAVGVNYLYLTLTVSVASGDNKSVSTAVLSIDTEDPEAQDTEIILKLAKINVTSSNGEKSAVVEHYTTGAIFYPPIPGYAAYTTGSGYLQTGLGNTETATAALPSEITGYILNVKEYFNLKVGESGFEMIDIDSTAIIDGRTIGVREIKNEAGTATGNVLATQDVTRGVEWAKYNGSSTAPGSLEIGGANVYSKVTQIDVSMIGNGYMIFGNDGTEGGSTSDFLTLNAVGGETKKMLNAYSTTARCTIGDDVLDNGWSFNCISNSSNGRASMGQGNIAMEHPSYGSVDMDVQDLPSGNSGASAAKFRQVKVCQNGVPKTAYVLMTAPQ